ncbi:HipA family kinase [Sansalvadorimonas verongulae]|uniref:HipA family kinase n=1 Tax=Sansalvadorimonas verongulae TaxID=2172824 RepID=UPI0012BBECA9|nr:HipA family kinase [Sansalvadorimonas verongulae]MTI12596.1 hypothetical protein [Sansalvadorimonas verongulae]
MVQRIQIDEVSEKLIQGKSGVHLCCGDDGHNYYVKGYQVERFDQAKEWICANLAKAFGLPVADFCLVDVDEYLYQNLKEKRLRDLGFGTCFASRQVAYASWPGANEILTKVSIPLQADILVFDWWIKNFDRTTVNPNLLWVPHEERLVVIDHNLSFDQEEGEVFFFNSHIFKDVKGQAFGHWVAAQEYQERMKKALEAFQPAVDTINEVWQWEDLEESRPFRLDSQALLTMLDKYKTPEFWSMK